MANNFFVSYDLHEPGKNYEAVISEIKKLGAWANVHYSLWYISTSLGAADAAKQVWNVMDTNDSLIVVDVTNNYAYWFNLSDEVSKFIQDHWRS